MADKGDGLMREWSRREFLRFSGPQRSGLLLGAALSGVRRPAPTGFDRRRAPARAKPLKTGYLPITHASPLLIAHAKGFYEAEGVEAERPYLFRGWSQIVEAFVAGQVDVIHVLMPTAVWMRFARRFPCASWLGIIPTARRSLSTPGIDRVLDLAGQTVAIPYWYSIHNVVLQQLLRHHGPRLESTQGSAWAADEVRLVVMAPSDMPAALANGSIAGYIVAEPFNAAAEVMEVGKILRFTGDVWLRHACCVVVMKEDDLERRPGAWAQSVINALVKAQLWMRENRGEAARLLSAEGYLPPASSGHRAGPHPLRSRALRTSGAIRHPEWGSARITSCRTRIPLTPKPWSASCKTPTSKANGRFSHAWTLKRPDTRLLGRRHLCPQGAGPGRDLPPLGCRTSGPAPR